MEQQIIQRYRREVYRIGWRLQYRSKKIYRNECGFLDINPIQKDEAEDIINRLSIEQLLDTLPAKGKMILQKLYLQELTEAEVAAQLHMSQQGVNKWKRRMIQQLSQTVNL
ncbi:MULTISPECIES: sigma factor-like helix-turn-helix DNA-binding protein [unclassified Paenibacillus]|uniref:sigma factor-like helix-turn-helix DNA-binding protein n=1 Tax=unclassified Paenibacillus TaxID=185978 RepID=UPI0030FA2B99